MIGRSRVHEGGRVRYDYQWTHKLILLVFAVGDFDDGFGNHCDRPNFVVVDVRARESNGVVETGVLPGSKAEVDDCVYERVCLLHD